jgi:hypothetical protein
LFLGELTFKKNVTNIEYIKLFYKLKKELNGERRN